MKIPAFEKTNMLTPTPKERLTSRPVVVLLLFLPILMATQGGRTLLTDAAIFLLPDRPDATTYLIISLFATLATMAVVLLYCLLAEGRSLLSLGFTKRGAGIEYAIGLAAGLGSFLYDMTNPLYVSEAWMTFLMKGAYGLVPGLIMLLWKNNWNFLKGAIATSGGALAYAALYLLKTYYKSVWVKLLTHEAAMIAVVAKIPATVFNAAVAIIFAPILALAIQKALKKNHLTLN